MRARACLFPAALLVTALSVPTLAADAIADEGRSKLRLQVVDSEPARGKQSSESQLATLRSAVEATPKDRRARFELVRALMNAGQLEEAEEAAIAWRESDAYNLVVVRLLGDIYSELGQAERAMRVYSAVVELLPKDHKAHRALASVLKQSGQLQPALDRLTAALEIRPEDARLRFELADIVQRLGDNDSARSLFAHIVDANDTPELLRYPAKERLAQSYQAQRRAAAAAGKLERAAELGEQIEELNLVGGTENDIKVYLTWDTDRSDVDLWLVNPDGEKIFYSHKRGRHGGRLFGDVTNGYGPESFTAKSAAPGKYKIQVNYFSAGSSNFPEARGEVVVVLHEGQDDEQRKVLPYRLFKKGQTVTVAKIHVRHQ